MITSTQNARVKAVVQLAQKARERKKEGRFIVEGTRMFREIPDDRLDEVFVSETYLKDHPAEAETLLKGKCYEAVTEDVMRTMSDTRTPQGILAVVRQREWKLADALSGTPLLMILETIQDPGNLGTILRAGEGAGVTGVIMNRETADIYSPKVIRSTMGSIFRVPFVITEDLRETIREIRETGVRLYAAHLKGKEAYENFDYTVPSGFLIGNEANGLTEETAALADTYIRIPMLGQVESLNAAVASSVLMFEAALQRRHKGEKR